jgi:hypothetical protein
MDITQRLKIDTYYDPTIPHGHLSKGVYINMQENTCTPMCIDFIMVRCIPSIPNF